MYTHIVPSEVPNPAEYYLKSDLVWLGCPVRLQKRAHLIIPVMSQEFASPGVRLKHVDSNGGLPSHSVWEGSVLGSGCGDAPMPCPLVFWL